MTIQEELKKLASPAKAKVLRSFFKTGPGQYGEGDVFIGVTIPKLRELAKRYSNASFVDLKSLLKSKVHEERTLSLLILVDRYKKGDEKLQKKIFDLYLRNTKWINNWDLVDASAPYIVGPYLQNRSKAV